MTELIVERDNNICTVTLNRPEKRNALSPEMMLELVAVLQKLQEEKEVRVVVLRGAGKEAFSAGFDISRVGPQPRYGDGRYQSPVEYAGAVIEECPFPVIAMIYGYAVGGGLELAVACDLRIAAATARLGMTPAKLGVIYLAAPLRRFLDLIGPGYTKELFLTGHLIDAQRAERMGLVNQVVPAEQLEEVTYHLAQEIAENAPLSLKGIKLSISRLTNFPRLSPEDEAFLAELRHIALQSEDLQEGKKAFLERRKPRFKGR
jgi:enoyl-CoA hydratase/carnithine racemase